MIDRKFSYKPSPKDKRDRSHSRTFGSVTPVQLPLEYLVVPHQIHDQLNTEFCTLFSTTASGEDQWGQFFAPEFNAMALYKDGKLDLNSGANLRDAMAIGVKYGFLPTTESPFTVSGNTSQQIVDQKNWQPALFDSAKKYRMDGYYSVDGVYDIFDNIRVALHMASQDPDDAKRTVDVGTAWYNEWYSLYPDGIVPETYKSYLGGHAIKVLGWVQKNGQPYLVVQNSYGFQFGDKGLCYFSRTVVNREFTMDKWIFRKNPDPEQIKTISQIVALLSKLVSLYQIYVKSRLQTR